MKTISRLIGWLCILAAWAVVAPVMLIEAGAVTVFISPSGVDTAGRAGGSGDPWATVSYALARVGGGNTVTMMDGSYPAIDLTSTYSGTLGNPTIIKAQNKWKAIINSTLEHGIYAAGSYYIFDGIKVTNAGIDGIKTDVLGVIVRNCWVLRAGGQGIASHDHNNCLFDSNMVEYNGTSTHLDHGFYLSGTNNIVRNNVVRHNAGYGIQIYPKGPGFHNAENRVYNNLVYNHPNEGGIVIYTDEADNIGMTNYVYGNTVHNASGTVSGAIKIRFGYAHITNNILISPTDIIVSEFSVVRQGFNLTSNPGWVNSGAGRYWLTAGSAARGAALGTIYGPVDFFGATQTSVLDMGAVQYTAAAAADTRTLDPSGSNPDYWASFGGGGGGPIYYVSTAGNDGNPGTQALPWRTIQHAANTMVAGNTAIVAAGSYGENVATAANGAAGSLITFRSLGASTTSFSINNQFNRIEGFTVTGFYPALSPAASILVRAGGTSSQIVSNLVQNTAGGVRGVASEFTTPNFANSIWAEGNRFIDTGDFSFTFDGRFWTVTNNYFRNRLGWDSIITTASDSTITHNTFTNVSNLTLSTISQSWTVPAFNADTPSLSVDSSADLYAGLNVEALIPAGWQGMQVVSKADGIHVVLRNTTNNGQAGASVSAGSAIRNANHTDIIQTDHFGNFSEVSTNMVFEGNHVINCINCQIGNLSAGPVLTMGWWTFRNNVYNNVTGTISIGMHDVSWYNNIFYLSGYNSGSPISFVNRPGNGGFGIGNNGKVFNNAFVECGDNTSASGFGWYGFEAGLTGTGANNNFVAGANWVAKTAFSESVGINGGNPLFLDFANKNFHLTAGSILVNHGTTIAGFSVDKDNVARPQSTAWDIGPYEYIFNQPTVTINQAGGQADPSNVSPVLFTVVFSAAVTGFATGDVTLSGTAGNFMTGTVTGSGTTYTVSVSGMTVNGSIIASVAAGVAVNAGGFGNIASTSTDNQVNFIATTPAAPTGLTGFLR